MCYSCNDLSQNLGVPEFKETKRNFAVFERRSATLPEQKPDDDLDYRSLLHRDGSVITSVTLDKLKQPEVKPDPFCRCHRLRPP